MDLYKWLCVYLYADFVSRSWVFINHHLFSLERKPTTVRLNLGETTPWEKQG